MGMIIISVIVMGCFFYGYIIYANIRQEHSYRSNTQHRNDYFRNSLYEYDQPRVIQLPENIEREKRRRHIR